MTSRDSGGGAPRAIHRIYKALRGYCTGEADVYLRVVHKSFDDNHIIGGKPTRNRWEYIRYLARTRFRKYFPRKPFVSDNKLLHSQALYDTGLGREIALMKPDVVMLGWLGNSTLSIREIGRLKAPVVWRLSDMWMFAGAEHYTEHRRFESGYSRKSRPAFEEGPDINRETFLRKRHLWKTPQHVISPSSWMATQVRSSVLTSRWSTHVVPNTIDLERWRHVDQAIARKRLRLPVGARIVLYGAGSGLKDHHKGGDLFLAAIEELASMPPASEELSKVPIVAVIFGEEGVGYKIGRIEVRFLGKLDDVGLRNAYSAADVMIVPSRLDNFPSTAVEAQSCGLPVVGFRAAGIPDIVDDNKTGLLVDSFDVRQLARAAWSLLEDHPGRVAMGYLARQRAAALWAPDRVAKQYLRVFQRAAQHEGVQK